MARDRFSNRVLLGPLKEVQVLTTSCARPCDLNGAFTVSFNGHSTSLEAGASIKEEESALEALDTVGAVTVTTESATEDATDGGAIAVTATATSPILQFAQVADATPVDMAAFFEVGDWIRIGGRDGLVYSVVAMVTATPYAVTIDMPYGGATVAQAPFYRQGTKGAVHAYQYVVTFDSNTGDLSALKVDGSGLKRGATGTAGLNAGVSVTACDWNRQQTIATSATSSLGGTFYVAYKGERTPDLPYDVDPDDLEAALTDLSDINAAAVGDSQDSVGYASADGMRVGAHGARRWTVSLVSVDGNPEPLYVEGHLLTGVRAGVSVDNACPSAGAGSFPGNCTGVAGCEVRSVAGRLGSEFLVELSGAASAKGVATYLDQGLYLGSFITPRVGSYELKVAEAQCCGLYAEMFNNRWLHGLTTLERIDAKVDFAWTAEDMLTPTGRDFISIRWTGLVQPAFGENYTFVIMVNDGARFYLDGELLLDQFEDTIDDTEQVSSQKLVVRSQ